MIDAHFSVKVNMTNHSLSHRLCLLASVLIALPPGFQLIFVKHRFQAEGQLGQNERENLHIFSQNSGA